MSDKNIVPNFFFHITEHHILYKHIKMSGYLEYLFRCTIPVKRIDSNQITKPKKPING